MLLELRPVEIPKCANTLIVNPEQSAPFVRLVPPYTYGFPRNCFAYATTAERVAFVTSFPEEDVPPVPGPPPGPTPLAVVAFVAAAVVGAFVSAAFVVSLAAAFVSAALLSLGFASIVPL